MSGLSVCMIARNEAPRISAALSSVAAIAKQIIVVDTGSTDDTKSIALHCNAEVVEHPWDDDFAAARNAAWPHVRQPWVLWLDADERVVRETCSLLPAMLATKDALAFSMTRHERIAGDQAGESSLLHVESRITRLVRADFGLQYTGRCHEQFQPSLGVMAKQLGMRVYDSPVILDHECDYFFDGRARKSRRNSPLLEREVRERPGRLYFMIQCAASLLELPETAARGHLMMIEVLKQVATLRDEARTCESILFLALEYAARYIPAAGTSLPLSADEALSLAIRWFPRAAPVVWLQAQREYDRGHYSAAVPLLRQLIGMGQTHSYDRELPFDPAIVGDDAYLNLGACLLRMGELDSAAAEFARIAPSSPRFAQAEQNLRALDGLRKL